MIFVLTPLIVITGLSMSPQMDTVPGLVPGADRRPAVGAHAALHRDGVVRAVRAWCMCVMVVYAGPINEMRSMITGRFRVRYPSVETPAQPPAPSPVAPERENVHE